MLDAGVASMIGTFLQLEGEPCIYRRGTNSYQITMGKRPERSAVVEVSGQITEVRFTDFICATSDLQQDPKRGDLILAEGLTYEVRTIGSEKPYRQTGPMTRIHTQLIGN